LFSLRLFVDQPPYYRLTELNKVFEWNRFCIRKMDRWLQSWRGI